MFMLGCQSTAEIDLGCSDGRAARLHPSLSRVKMGSRPSLEVSATERASGLTAKWWRRWERLCAPPRWVLQCVPTSQEESSTVLPPPRLLPLPLPLEPRGPFASAHSCRIPSPASVMTDLPSSENRIEEQPPLRDAVHAITCARPPPADMSNSRTLPSLHPAPSSRPSRLKSRLATAVSSAAAAEESALVRVPALRGSKVRVAA